LGYILGSVFTSYPVTLTWAPHQQTNKQTDRPLITFQRLKSFPIREHISDDDKVDDEPLIFTGTIYGVQVDAISEQVGDRRPMS
jgi:hypothetical protein